MSGGTEIPTLRQTVLEEQAAAAWFELVSAFAHGHMPSLEWALRWMPDGTLASIWSVTDRSLRRQFRDAMRWWPWRFGLSDDAPPSIEAVRDHWSRLDDILDPKPF